MTPPASGDPHGGCEIYSTGTPVERATCAIIALHGRGASASSILQLRQSLTPDRDNVTFLAPQAANRTWYPHSFLVPQEKNEPYLSSALAAVDRTIERAAASLDRTNIVLLGFSQGACLASEYMAREQTRYGALIAFSGGLIGERVEADQYDGSLDGTPVYLGCSDDDPHIPVERVHTTAEVLTARGGDVTSDIIPGMGHTIVEQELAHARTLIQRCVDSTEPEEGYRG